jgi:hypothetical protein
MISREQAFTDPSCLHAALGTVILEHRAPADLATFLGNTVATTAIRDEDGVVAFGHKIPPLLAAARARGCHFLHKDLQDPGELDAMLAAVRDRRSVIAFVDSFHLAHYWIDRGRTHQLHAVNLRSFDSADGTVRLTDAMDTTYFDDRVPLASLMDAICDERQRQLWIRMEEMEDPGTLPREVFQAELIRHSETLAGTARDGLSGVELVTEMSRNADRIIASTQLIGKAVEPGSTTPAADKITRVMFGIWSYHHTLRWFGRYLSHYGSQFADDRADKAAATVGSACQNLLAVRGLLMRCSVSGSDRRSVYRKEIQRRLHCVLVDLQTTAEIIYVMGSAQ